MAKLERDKNTIDIQTAVCQIYKESNLTPEEMASSLAALTGLIMITLDKNELNLLNSLFEMDVFIKERNKNE